MWTFVHGSRDLPSAIGNSKTRQLKVRKFGTFKPPRKSHSEFGVFSILNFHSSKREPGNEVMYSQLIEKLKHSKPACQYSVKCDCDDISFWLVDPENYPGVGGLHARHPESYTHLRGCALNIILTALQIF